MPGLLRDVLLEHRQRRGEPADDALVFGQAGGAPFSSATLYRRADTAWRKAGLAGRLRLHQARQGYASYLIAAGANPKAISAFMGHASINVTFDLYGHLMPGTAAEVASLLSGYLGKQVRDG